MKAVANAEGKIAIAVVSEADGSNISFKVGAVDGAPFEPLHEVEIPDERLDAAIQKLLAPFGEGPWRRV